MTANVLPFPSRRRSQPGDAPAEMGPEARKVIADLERLLVNVPAITDEERARRDAWLDRDEWPRRLSSSGIREAISDESRLAVLMDRCTAEPALTRTRTWYEARRSTPPSGSPWLIVCGPVGVGKSTAAAWCLARSWGVYVTMTTLLADFATWKRGHRDERNTGNFARYRRAAFLVLDEVGTERDDAADAAREAMFALVDARQSKRCETLVLSNLTATQMRDRIRDGVYDIRSADRLRAMATLVGVTGASLRKSVPGGGL